MTFKVRPKYPHDFLDEGLIRLQKQGRYITELDLSSCEKITDKGLLSLSCPNLSKVTIRWCENITAQAIVTFLANCPKLTELILRAPPEIDDRFFSALDCPNLLECTLYDLGNVTDNGLQAFLSNTPLLTHLTILDAPHVHGQFLSSSVQLHSLTLRRVSITLQEITIQLPQLSTLILDIPAEGAQLFTHLCPHLQDLTTYEWIQYSCKMLKRIHLTKIDDTGLLQLANSCRMLEDVYIVNGRKITDQGFSSLLSLCPMIFSLKIERCSSLEGKEVQGIEQLRLSFLQLDDCTSLSDEGVYNLMKVCSQVSMLSLTNCSCLTGKSFVSIANYSMRLEDLKLTNLRTPIRFAAETTDIEYINLSNSEGVTDETLEDVAAFAPDVKKIVLSDCPNITIKGLLHLVEHCQNLSMLILWRCKISEPELRMLEEKAAIQIDAYRGLKAYSPSNQDFSFDYYKNTLERDAGIEKIESLLTEKNQLYLREFPGKDNKVDLSNILCLDLAELSINDQTLAHLLEQTPHLLKLNIYNCYELTDNALNAIGKLCPELMSLELEFGLFTHKGVLSLLKQCPKMISFICEHCDNIRAEGLEVLYLQLIEQFPALGFRLH